MKASFFAFCLLGFAHNSFAQSLEDALEKTIIPIEIATPDMQCSPRILTPKLTGASSNSEFFVGQYREFTEANLNSPIVDSGLNFILNKSSDCDFTDSINSFAMSQWDLQTSQIEFQFAGIHQSDISSGANKWSELTKSQFPEVRDAALASQRACPWDQIESKSGDTFSEALNCRVYKIQERTESVEVPTAQEGNSWMQLFGIALAKIQSAITGPEEKAIVGDPRSENSADVLAYYQNEADFTLKMEKGTQVDTTQEPVKIESFMVCTSEDKSYLLSFAVMEKRMAGVSYLCR